MKKLIIILLFGLVMLAPGGLVKAAYNDFVTDGSVTVNISDLSINLTISSGANVEQMIVGTGSVTFSVLSGSTATITSSDRRTLTASGFGNDTQFTCPGTGSSTLTIVASATRTGVITPSTTDCSNTIASSGGGGGGGGGIPTPTIVTPSNPSVSIGAGAAEATSRDVVLTLSATSANQMMISNNNSFEGASWETYATSKNWTLASGLGKKTVYAKFQSSSGGISALATDDIMLLPAPAVKAITMSAGGHVGLSDDLVAVDLPANAVSKNTNISITATSVFTAPTGKTKLAGSQVYDFKADADGTSVKNFSKDLTLTFKYTADDIKGLSEESLAIYYWNETTSAWVKVGGTIDKIAKTVTAKVNHFTLYAILGEESATAGQLVKLKCDATNKSICTAVYYIGNDGKRYVFPTEKTYLTWYTDFSGVKEISATELASYRIGGNITYRPGTRMVKITTDPKVYVVSKGGVLKEIASEAVAKSLFGATWNKQIDDLPDPFFVNYEIGAKVNAASDYVMETEKSASASVNIDKGL
jgi:hypothetical protein